MLRGIDSQSWLTYVQQPLTSTTTLKEVAEPLGQRPLPHRQAGKHIIGQIVVARLEDEVTVKHLQRRGSRVELMAENPDYAPIVVKGSLVIEGLVVGLIRGGRAL
jgi:hypothetical protein